ncbi:MAG: hypothetical protein JWR50_2857 [Mucilaginibacter sp.]|nr:hypothetical protein [Mucilaginibacter sp.]
MSFFLTKLLRIENLFAREYTQIATVLLRNKHVVKCVVIRE